MLIDARTIPAGERIETEVCIIGAGAAGLALARAFAGRQFRVALIAGGGLAPDRDTQSLYAGPNVGLPYFSLEYSRAHCFGGTTAWWGGHCRPQSDFDFEPRSWIPNSGWPIRVRDIVPYRQAAEQMCSLKSGQWDPQYLTAGSGLEPLPFNPALLETRVAQVISPSSQRRFGVVYRDEVEKAENVTTYLNASVTEIDTDDSGQTVTAVKVACIDGPRFTVAPKMCILAAGGLENPRMLLVSNRVQKTGLGNQHDLVGRYFLEHPRFDAGIFYPTSTEARKTVYGPHKLKNGTAIKSYVAPTPEVMRAEQLVDVQIRLASIPEPQVMRSRNSLGFAALRRLVNDLKRGTVPEDFGANVLRVFTDIDNVALASYYTLAGQGGVRPMLVTTRVDPVPNPESRVTLTSARDALGMPGIQLAWRLSSEDKRSARRAMEIFANEVGRAGLGRVQITFADDGDATRWPASLEGGWHQMGTTRMSDDPKTGVVDRDCRVHGMSNLWVAGSSVFATGGSGTPTMTIVTLAYRLADHIKGRLA